MDQSKEKKQTSFLEHLSFSSLSKFLQSPNIFHHEYILGNKAKSTKAMNLGNRIDKWLTGGEEEYFKTYIIRKSDMEIPSSAQQKGFCEDIVNAYANQGINIDAVETYKKYYSTSKKKDEKIKEEAQNL